MPADRRGPSVIGLLAAFTGAVLFLAAGDVISLPDTMFGAPRWIVALFALGFFFGGGYAVSLALPVRWMRRALGGAAALAFLTAAALLMTWLAVTGGGARRAHPPARAGSLVFGPEVGVRLALRHSPRRDRARRVGRRRALARAASAALTLRAGGCYNPTVAPERLA